MKKLLCTVLIALLILSCAPAFVLAEDGAPEFLFALTVDGQTEKQVVTGDVITVMFTLKRTDSSDDYTMYAMQDEIHYDSEFFELVEGSELIASGIRTTDIAMRDTYREFYMNYVDNGDGTSWSSSVVVGSFQLKVIGKEGASIISNRDYLVSNKGGTGSYEAVCQDVLVKITDECTVRFESNGGTEVESQKVKIGKKVKEPDEPKKEGYHLEGWYSDIDLAQKWNFAKDSVQCNMTLYAKWAEGEPAAENGGRGAGRYILWGAGILLGLLLLVLLLLVKTVSFETYTDMKIPSQRKLLNTKLERPMNPAKQGAVFGGWYTDEAFSKEWDFENDKVRKSMTLYAKWK